VKKFNPNFLLNYSALILLSTAIIACNKPENQNIPSLADGSKAYFDLLESGDKKKLSDVFFMPLHQKDIKHLIMRFNQNHDNLISGVLKLDIEASHQKGRWGIITLNKTMEQQEALESLWFFYYQQKWRVISPEIYHTKELHAMMNLYPEHEELKKWLPKKEGK